jgi:uncharacterized MAPEG superfamily protein
MILHVTLDSNRAGGAGHYNQRPQPRNSHVKPKNKNMRLKAQQAPTRRTFELFASPVFGRYASYHKLNRLGS